MNTRSLTARLAGVFALLCMAALGLVGMLLYQGLAMQLTLRDDAALVSRIEQIRVLLQDDATLALVHAKPQVFGNMLGNREALLVLQYPGEAPLFETNPGRIAIPQVPAVASGEPLTLAAVTRSVHATGIPFIAVAANMRAGGAGKELRITAGRLMSERSRILADYRRQIVLASIAAGLLAAACAFFLVRRGLRPLALLAAQASTIGVSNLDTRLDVAAAPRELAPLVSSFNAMLARLSVGFAKLSQVSEDMAHDLRTPIAILMGQTEVALGQQRSADYYHSLLVSNQEELQRLSRMTDNMLFLARSDHASGMIAPEWLAVDEEFERVNDYFEGIAEERGIHIDCSNSGSSSGSNSNSNSNSGSGRVWGDPGLLRRALANLLSNAVKYADAGSTIVLSAQAAPHGMTLIVENAGPQIDAEQLARLFDRFYRGDAARSDSSQSSGLGLAIVHNIMVLHRGTAQATSSAGSNRFLLHFPAAQ